MYKVISFGHRCTSSGFIKHLGLKTESYPFDWLISNLNVIQDCIETNFIHFLNVNNYKEKHMEVSHLIDNRKEYYWSENVNVNEYYENDKNNNSAYHTKLGINHRNLNVESDYEYYKRCINRLYDLLKTDIKKYYIHFKPIIGINEFEHNKEDIIKEFENFNIFIKTKTTNIFGIYFILIKHNETIKSFKFRETNNYVVFIIYCNNDFIDSGVVMYGNCDVEQNEVIHILKNILK